MTAKAAFTPKLERILEEGKKRETGEVLCKGEDKDKAVIDAAYISLVSASN